MKCETCKADAPRLHQSYDPKKRGAFECDKCALRDKGMNSGQRARIKQLNGPTSARAATAAQKGVR
jgi:Zn finger protein HypA/HybF involved in hydrogenase expression